MYSFTTVEDIRRLLDRLRPGLAARLEDVFQRLGRDFKPDTFSPVLKALLAGLFMGDGHNRATKRGAHITFQVRCLWEY